MTKALLLPAAAALAAAVRSSSASSIVGPTWNALRVRDADSAALEDVLAGTALTLLLQDDGSLRGDSGCNTFFGSYSGLTEASFDVPGGLATGFKMCEDGIMEQEDSYQGIFAEARTINYSVSEDGTGLELNDAGTGEVLAQYEAAAPVDADGGQEQEPPPQPVMCTMDWRPVCGEDGKVYSNACEAGAAGVGTSFEIENPAADLAQGADCPPEELPPDDADFIACPAVWAPVCGTDGRVYSNDCDAGAKGVDVAYEIANPADGLTEGTDCPPADLAEQVIPEPPPVACTADWQPVCGSDGKVYSNACEAGAAGANVTYAIDTPAEDLAAGTDCDPEQQVTGPEPVMCTTEWKPVCGSDGKVYSNACNAEAEGVEALYEIKSPADDLASGDDCDPEQQAGPPPTACTADWRPVCGADGKVYSNACNAEAEGVEASYEIESPAVDLAPGAACDPEQQAGPPPIACTADWRPVCGADGKVYSNECDANAAGVEASYEIEFPAVDLASGDACDASVQPVEQPPNACTADWRPVCGSDGKVYSNACEAEAAGVEAAYEIESPAEDLAPGADCNAPVQVVPYDTNVTGTEANVTEVPTPYGNVTEPPSDDPADDEDDVPDSGVLVLGTSVPALVMAVLALMV